jgi:DNA-binding LacI/PurR family transcriptional regulator
MRKLPSSQDVARLAGVSRTTVSYVLNGRTNLTIPEETRTRVLDAARTLGYRPNRLVVGMVKGKTRTLGIIVSRLDSPYFAHVVQGFQEVCDQQDYRILLEHTQHDPAREVRQVNLLLEHRVDGLLWIADDWTVQQARDWIAPLVEEGLPCVVTDDTGNADLVDTVTTEDFVGARDAVRYLLALGHRRIAHLSAGERLSNSRARREGYEEALREAGIAVDPALIVADAYDLQNPESDAAALFDTSAMPTAVFTAYDEMALAMLQQMRRRGLRVPEDMSLIGYGDTTAAKFLDLTTVRQNPQEVGRQAAHCLLARLKAPERALQSIEVPTELILRATCGPPRSGSLNLDKERG